MKEHFLALNEEWKLYLDSLTEQVQADIRNILLTDQIVKYQFGKSRQNIVAFYFEYQYDSMNIMLWAQDKNGDEVADPIEIPTTNNTDKNSSWKSLVPENILKRVYEMDNTYEGDDYDEIRREYENIKTELFERWFLNCWNTATKEIENIPDAYFSIHDTYFLTDLKTGKEINSDQIAERYK